MKNKKEKSAKIISKIMIVLICTLALGIVASVVYFGYVFYKLSDLEYRPETTATPTVEIKVEVTAKPTDEPTATIEPTATPEPINDVINILVIGCDTKKRGKYGNARSDVNMILTIDEENDEIKLSTFMRDTLIYYDEIEDYQRLNFALQYFDHPDGVARTLEKNFDIEVDYYMLTDYWGMADLIDIFNGVKIHLSDEEISELNDILACQNRLNKDDVRKDFVPHDPGVLRLTGRQAVAFMRIRHIGSDLQRVERQFEVLEFIKGRLVNMNIIEINKVLNKLPDLISTDMNQKEILSITKKLYSMKDNEMQSQRLPFKDTYKNARYQGMAIIEIDFEKNIELLHEYMYE